MQRFTVELQRSYSFLRGGLHTIPSSISIEPLRWSDNATWGNDAATLEATGPVEQLAELLAWVGDRAFIRNAEGRTLWYGMIHEVEIDAGGAVLVNSLEGVANRVKVRYVTRNAAGIETAAETAWAEDARSITRHGLREIKLTAPQGSLESGEAMRALALARMAWPQPVIRGGSTGGSPRATITCRGFATLLDEIYYSNPRGLVEHTTTGGSFWLGAWFSSNQVSFTAIGSGITKCRVTDDGGRMAGLVAGDTLTLTGSAFPENTGTFTVHAPISANMIEVTATNLKNEAAGPVIVAQFEHGLVMAFRQSFTVTEGGWKAKRVNILAGRTGNPAGDVFIRLLSDVGGTPGAVLDIVSLPAAALPTGAGAWIELAFSGGEAMLGAGTYWLQIERSAGSEAVGNRVRIGMDSNLGYTGGVGRVFNGAAWVAHNPDCDLGFRVTGLVDRIDMVREMLEKLDIVGDGLTVSAAVGLATWQYRDGSRTARDEAEEILAAGDSMGRRLMVQWMAKPYGSTSASIRIAARGNPEADSPVLGPDGGIYRPGGTPWGDGRLLSGRWLIADALPALDGFTSPGRAVFVETSEYDAGRGRLYFSSEGATDPLAGIRRRLG